MSCAHRPSLRVYRGEVLGLDIHNPEEKKKEQKKVRPLIYVTAVFFLICDSVNEKYSVWMTPRGRSIGWELCLMKQRVLV